MEGCLCLHFECIKLYCLRSPETGTCSGGSLTPLNVPPANRPTALLAGIPVRLQPKCNPRGDDSVQPGQGACSWNVTTSTKEDGWDEVQVPLAGGGLAANITGVRYAWGENPCCPSFNRQVVPCPPNSCPIQSFNSTLPAVPFWATIGKDGRCDFISTQPRK